MIIDMHVHTSSSSGCSSLDPGELIEKASALGLDAVAVTEHGVMGGADTAREMGIARGFRVFRGVEVHTPACDVLVFGLGCDVGRESDFTELMEEVARRDAAAVIAHPARGYWGHHSKFKGACPEEVYALAHAVETRNGQCSRRANDAAAMLARRFNLPSTGGSDAHHPAHVGRCVTVFERELESERAFIEEIKAERCSGAYLEELAARGRKSVVGAVGTGEP